MVISFELVDADVRALALGIPPALVTATCQVPSGERRGGSSRFLTLTFRLLQDLHVAPVWRTQAACAFPSGFMGPVRPPRRLLPPARGGLSRIDVSAMCRLREAVLEGRLDMAGACGGGEGRGCTVCPWARFRRRTSCFLASRSRNSFSCALRQSLYSSWSVSLCFWLGTERLDVESWDGAGEAPGTRDAWGARA